MPLCRCLAPFAALIALAPFATPARAATLDLFAPAAPPRAAALQRSVVRGAAFARLAGDALDQARNVTHATVSLPADGGALTLELDRASILAPGATITTTGDAGPRRLDPGVVVMRGRVAGEPASSAVVTIGPAGAMGFVETRGRRLVIAPVAGDLHRIADEAQLPAPTTPLRCGMDEADAPPPRVRPTPFATLGSIATTATRYVCNLAIDCDYEWTQTKFSGSTAAASQYVMTMFAAISLIYERDIGTTIQLGYLNLWTTSADPYTQTSALNQLFEFQSYWNANRQGVVRTIAHLVSGRNLNGGYSFIGVLCSDPTAGYGYGVTSTDGNNILPNNVTGRDVWLLAHEVGHEFGSYHTQSCNWGLLGYCATNALLDSCYAQEGSCYSGPTGIIPRDKGTIMSYCDQLSGGSQSNDRLAFHPACADLMRQSVEASCMATAAVQPPTQLAVTPSGTAAHLAWTASSASGVLHYDVYRSSWQLDLAPQLVGSTAGTTFDDPIPWSTFYYRVRAVRAGDQSDASNEAAFTRCPLAVTNGFTGGTLPLGIATGDFNEDGNVDLAVTQNSISKVAIFLGHGDGTFADRVTYSTGTAPSGVVAGDFDDDGILDLAVANTSTNNVSILLGQGAGGVGNGTFGAPVNYATSFGASALVAGDFNEDGIVDLAVVNTSASSLTVLLGNGADGHGDGSFHTGSTLTGQGSGLKDVVSGEITGDGITDLVIMRNAGGRTLPGNGSGGKGNGAFLVGNSLTAGSTCSAIAAGDLNGDGILDVVIASNLSNTLSPYFSIFLGNGSGGVPNGTFAPRVDVPTAPSVQSLAVADWTGDGLADVAVGANNSSNGVLVYPGLGNGQLGGSMWINTGGPVRSLAAADVDNDGVLDLIAVNNSNSAIYVIRTACDRELANGATVGLPNGGEIWIAPSEHVLTWTRDPGCASVNLELSRDGGVNWESIARNVVGSSYKWTVTGPYSNQCRLRVSNAFVAGAADLSNANFTIVPQNLLDAPAGPRAVVLAIRSIAPNPARGVMAITLALPSAAPATLELLDVAGRRVRSERVSAEAGGEARVEWRNVGLAAGVYVLRVEQGGRKVTAKVAVLDR